MYTKSLASEIIQHNYLTESKFLDLGNAGLHDNAPELELLSSFKHLESINFGTYYYEETTQVFSNNKGEPNIFTKIPEYLPRGIKKLWFNQVSLESVSNLKLYDDLEIFDGFGNNISTFSWLSPNDKLVSLGLSNNKLVSIEGIQNFKNLKYLYLGKNQLQNIEPDIFKTLTKLTDLYLYSNSITNINFLQGCDSLRRISLELNNIEDIDLIGDLIWLETLDISKNPLKTRIAKNNFHNNAAQIRSILKKMSLPELLIRENIIKKEKFLDLGNCGLNELSKEFDLFNPDDFRHLTSLNLGIDYYLDDNPVANTKNYFAKNRFLNVPSLNLPGLLELQIRDCNLEMMSHLSHLKDLELLDLSFNRIHDIADLENLSRLKGLALFDNQVTKINGLESNLNLETLHLESNRIQVIENLRNNTKLKSLYVDDNMIENVRPIISLKSLKQLSVKGNPILDCPSDIWKSNDLNQIKVFFDNLKRQDIEKKIANDKSDVKLIILGNSNTGKTNLVHYLQTGKFLNTRNSTHGLEVKRWTPNTKIFPQLKDIQVSIWDFGGQEYYHDAYKLFLGSDAVYLIMWCADSDENKIAHELVLDNEKLVATEHYNKIYWLDTINYFKDANLNMPLFLVQNKVDVHNHKIRISQEMHSEYFIEESFHVSIKEGCNDENKHAQKALTDFSSSLADALAHLAKTNAQHTNDYKTVRNELLKLEGKETSRFRKYVQHNLFISIADFNSVCSDLEIVNNHFFPEWLDKGGIVLFFPDDEQLKDKIFINPSNLSKQIYALLNREVLHNNGEFLKDAKLDVNTDRHLIIDVMKSLSLIYDHPAKPETHYLVPQYLPEDHPIEDLFTIASSNAWQDSFWIKVPMFFYKKIMHYLLLNYIEDRDTKARYFWKNGIVLLKNNKKLLIKGLYPSDKEGIIQISVEDGHDTDALKKEILLKIENFTSKNKQVKKRNPADVNNINHAAFLNKLQVSIDKNQFDDYKKMKRMAEQAEADPQNLLIKYKHILPFKVEGSKPKNVFISYSHKDILWLKKIKTHLAGLRRGNYIKDWTDLELHAGDNWDNKIREQMSKADVFILLVSADFIASDYSWNYELSTAIKSRTERNVSIIPVYIESCDLSAIPVLQDFKILDLEIIPKDEFEQLKPLGLWKNEAEGLEKVARRIRDIIVSSN